MQIGNVIMLRRRLILGVFVLSGALAAWGSYATLPVYSSTCTIRQEDDGTLMMEFIKRHPEAKVCFY